MTAFAWLAARPTLSLGAGPDTMRELFREITQLVVAVAAMAAVVALALVGRVSGEVAVGFMGTVIGYIFGRSVGSVQTARAVEQVRNGGDGGSY